MDTRTTRHQLVEASGERHLRTLGVTPRLETTGVGIDAPSVESEDSDGARSRVPARTVIWAAGVTASPLAGLLAAAAGVETDRAGRITVEPELTLAGHPEVFALGDMVTVRGQQLHGVAPVAMQQGRHAAHSIARGSRGPFRYRDKGELATIGRSRAVGVVKGVRVSGFLAWALWLGIHITYLVGVQNRLLVLTRWTFSYVTRGRGARVIHRS